MRESKSRALPLGDTPSFYSANCKFAATITLQSQYYLQSFCKQNANGQKALLTTCLLHACSNIAFSLSVHLKTIYLFTHFELYEVATCNFIFIMLMFSLSLRSRRVKRQDLVQMCGKWVARLRLLAGVPFASKLCQRLTLQRFSVPLAGFEQAKHKRQMFACPCK